MERIVSGPETSFKIYIGEAKKTKSKTFLINRRDIPENYVY